MGYWLLKSEPDDYSFDDLKAQEQDLWDGVKNFKALRNMSGMRRGDHFFFYHTGKERAIVGTGEVVSDPFPDPEQNNPRRLVIEVRAGERLTRPVTLKEIKADERFGGWELVHLPRLSVVPVSEPHWRMVLEIAGYYRPSNRVTPVDSM